MDVEEDDGRQGEKRTRQTGSGGDDDAEETAEGSLSDADEDGWMRWRVL